MAKKIFTFVKVTIISSLLITVAIGPFSIYADIGKKVATNENAEEIQALELDEEKASKIVKSKFKTNNVKLIREENGNTYISQDNKWVYFICELPLFYSVGSPKITIYWISPDKQIFQKNKVTPIAHSFSSHIELDNMPTNIVGEWSVVVLLNGSKALERSFNIQHHDDFIEIENLSKPEYYVNKTEQHKVISPRIVVEEKLKDPSNDTQNVQAKKYSGYVSKDELAAKKIGVLICGTIDSSIEQLIKRTEVIRWDPGGTSAVLLNTRFVHYSKYNFVENVFNLRNANIFIVDDGFRPLPAEDQYFIPVGGHLEAIFKNVKYVFEEKGYEAVSLNSETSMSGFDDNKTLKEIIEILKTSITDIDAVLLIFYANSGSYIKYEGTSRKIEEGLILHAFILMYDLLNKKIFISSNIIAGMDDIPKDSKEEKYGIFGGKKVFYNSSDLLKIFYRKVRKVITDLVPQR